MLSSLACLFRLHQKTKREHDGSTKAHVEFHFTVRDAKLNSAHEAGVMIKAEKLKALAAIN
jgi:hypothetical protein